MKIQVSLNNLNIKSVADFLFKQKKINNLLVKKIFEFIFILNICVLCFLNNNKITIYFEFFFLNIYLVAFIKHLIEFLLKIKKLIFTKRAPEKA